MSRQSGANQVFNPPAWSPAPCAPATSLILPRRLIFGLIKPLRLLVSFLIDCSQRPGGGTDSCPQPARMRDVALGCNCGGKCRDLALRRRFISLFAMSRTKAPADRQLWFLRPFPPRRAIGHWNLAVRAGAPRTRRYDRFSDVEGSSLAPSPAVGTLRKMAAALPPSPHAQPAVGRRLWRRVSRALRPCRQVRRATS